LPTSCHPTKASAYQEILAAGIAAEYHPLSMMMMMMMMMLQVNATNAGNYTAAMNTGTAWLSTGLWAPAGEGSRPSRFVG
jgi:hypothetical protein